MADDINSILPELQKDIDKTIQQMKEAVERVNREQDEKRKNAQSQSPQFIVHGSHFTPEDFQKTYTKKYPQAQSNKDEMFIPSFSKETQNELTAIKEIKSKFLADLREKHPPFTHIEDKELLEKINFPSTEELRKKLKIPERIFGIPTKTENNKAILDKKGLPVPQIGSYAYAIKKCSYSIQFSEKNLPILIGGEKEYKEFEEGKMKGHLYTLEGKGFNPEFNHNGDITEYTASHDAKVINHEEVTPHKAMQLGCQLIIFKNGKSFDKWANDRHFNFKLPENSDAMKALAHEISAGRATYINATGRGVNPLFPTLAKAQEQYETLEKSKQAVERIYKKIDESRTETPSYLQPIATQERLFSSESQTKTPERIPQLANQMRKDQSTR